MKILFIFCILSSYWLVGSGWKLSASTISSVSMMRQRQNQPQPPQSPRSPLGSLQMALTPSSSLMKKGKRKFIDSLYEEVKQQGDAHVITQFLKTGKRPPFIDKPMDFYAMMRYLGVFIVMPEYNKRVKTNFIYGMPPAEIMGGVYRDAGARAIIVSVDNRTGGVSPEDFASFTREQSQAKTFLPGSIPVVWNDLIIDKIQIHYAAALGAAAVTIQEELVDNITEILSLCKRYKMEPIFMIRNVEEFQSGLSKNIRCYIAHQLDEEGFFELRNQIPSKKERPDLFIAAKFRPSTDYSLYFEIDLAWGVRGVGYDGVWPSPDGLYGSEMSDVYSGIIAMKAKASRRFLSPRQFLAERKKEGVTEYLGDVLY